MSPSQRARVMLVIHSMSGGGSERQMSYLANDFAEHYETALVTLDHADRVVYPLSPQIKRIGLGLVSERGGPIRGTLANVQRIRAIRRVAAEFRANVVLSFCDSNNILTALACGRRWPVVLAERSDPRNQRLSRIWEFLRDRAYPRARGIISQTQSVQSYLQSRYARHANQIDWRTIPSAIQTPTLDPTAIVQTRETEQVKRILFVGRLSREKRVDRLITAWSKLSQDHSDWRLRIVGDGAERLGLEQLSASLGLNASIEWRAWASNVWPEFEQSHVLCLTSEYEGFPQAMLEGMATGIACVVFDCSPAIRETITSGVNGIIVSDQAEFETALSDMIINNSLRQSLGAQAFERSQDYRWSTIGPQWHEAVQAAIKR